MSISVFESLLKETFFVGSKTLLELTSTNTFFKDFSNTLTKCKINAKRIWNCQTGFFFREKSYAEFYLEKKKRNSNRDKEIVYLFICVLDNNRSIKLLKFSNSKFLVKVLI